MENIVERTTMEVQEALMLNERMQLHGGLYAQAEYVFSYREACAE